jgi:hypothetical protein
MSADNVKTLSKKAADAKTADDAMKFAQAACNVANAMCAVKSSEIMKKD